MKAKHLISAKSVAATLLFSVFPILTFYVNNISELSINFQKAPIFYSLLITSILLAVASLLYKNIHKGALSVLVLVFIFFTYGHISNYLDDKLFIKINEDFVLGPDKILLPLVLFAYLIFVLKLFKSKSGLSKILTTLAFVGLLLTLYPSIVIAHNQYKLAKLQSFSIQSIQPKIKITAERPDVYHIILDGYARNDVLKSLYSYDNSDFTDELTSLGFFVDDNARSNYIHTYVSLPSTFNMMYLDELPEVHGINPPTGYAARDMMRNNLALQRFKELGYKTISFDTWWEGTDESYQADTIYEADKTFKIANINVPTSHSTMTFLSTTLLTPLISEVWDDIQRVEILGIYERLPDIAYQAGPKYTLAHVIAPHPPYLFDKDGNPNSGEGSLSGDEGIEKRPEYVGQLEYISKLTLATIKKLIANSSNLPIIILHADHGPASTFGKREDWQKNYSETALKERSAILYAIYFPDGDYLEFEKTNTPVNTYRILFNKYFGENYELLPDKVYYSDYDAIYKFEDITDIGN